MRFNLTGEEVKTIVLLAQEELNYIDGVETTTLSGSTLSKVLPGKAESMRYHRVIIRSLLQKFMR